MSFLLNAVNPLTRKSMLSEVKERLEGPKYNIDFGGKGLGYCRGEGDRYVHYAKRGHFWEVSTSTLLFLIVGSLACIHTTKVEQWASVCLELV